MDTNEERKAKLKQCLLKNTNKDKNPCPKCGSFDIFPQTPIKIDEEMDISNPRQMLGAWARAHKSNGAELEGPCYFICRECGHKGPDVDCSGMTSQEVGQDKEIYAKMKRLWNSQ